MRILYLSSHCSTPQQPNRSPGNARILRALRREAECLSMIPVRWYPQWMVRLRPQLAEQRAVTRVETDIDGYEVLHPRVLHLPGLGRSLYGALFVASLFARVRKEVARFRPDVILSACAYPDGTAAVALGELLGLPVIVRTLGNDINVSAQESGRRFQIRWALRRAGRVIAVSRALGQAVAKIGVPEDRITVVPTGIDPAVFRPHDRVSARSELALGPDPVVLVAARLSPEKGLLHLLEAMSLLRESRFQLVLVGDGQERAHLEAEVQRRGLHDRVRFEGFQPEGRLPLYYSAADLVCLPSLMEGWPDTIMEGFACGCPVVASAVGGIPDMLALTNAGRLVPPGDAVALSQALRDVLATSWDREAIVTTMSKHTLAATARRYLELCEQVLTERKTVHGRAVV